MKNNMRAVTYSNFGKAQDVLSVQFVETPTPNHGEVLVRLLYSGVNPSDAKARAGGRPGVKKPPFDVIIPHSDGSGIIEAVGEGVDQYRIGQKVWIWNGGWQRAMGTAAQFIAIPNEQAIEMPPEMDFQTAATLGIPALTAAQTVCGGDPIKGQTLLISGGGGSVGHMAIQLAKFAGARVITTANPQHFERLQLLGADHILDYSSPTLIQDIKSLSPQGVDRVIEVELGQNIDMLHDVIKPLGTLAVYGSGKEMQPIWPFGPYLFKAIKIDITLIYILPLEQRLKMIEYIHSAFEAGAFLSHIDQIFDINECAAAHDATMKSGRKGAILLDLS